MKKGFTLVELLAVIILLGLLGLIIYPTVNGIINNNKQKLHDKQIEELIRYGNTYASMNMSKLRTYNNARNIVTINDLYEAGLIQSSIVIDPLDDQVINGCLALTWKDSINNFEIELSDNCEKVDFTDSSCFTYTINKNDELVITGYDRTCPMDVIIPENIDGKEVKIIGEEAMAGYDTKTYDAYPNEQLLTSVIIPNTVTRIETQAFADNNINNLKLGNSVERILNGAFSDNKLTDLVLPDSVISIDGSFTQNQLTSVTLSKNMTSIEGYSFYNNKLTAIDIPDSVTTIGDHAFGNNQLVNVVLGKNVREIRDQAFVENQIASIELPNTVKRIGLSAFRGNKLTHIVIPDSVVQIENHAFGENQLTEVIIGTGVTNIYSNAFAKNATFNINLTKIVNKSGKEFQWYGITGCANDTTSFVTGTVTCSPSNIEITSN